MAQLMTEDERNFYRSQTELAKEQIKSLERQIKYIEKQEEFIELQKKDLSESKKDRKSLNKFTLVLAFGVVVSIFFNLFQIVTQFIQSESLHSLIISSIFIFLFLFYIGFLMHIFPMKKEMQSYFKKEWKTILAFLVIIIILGLTLFFLPNALLPQ